MAANLGEGDLHGPTSNEPAQHHERIGLQVGAQQALRREGAVRIAHQNPADRNLLAGVVPQGRAGSDVQLALLAAIPAGDPDAPPSGGGVVQALRQRRQSGSRHPGPFYRAWRPRWGRFEQAGVQTQARDDGKMGPQVAQQFDGRVAAVGDRDYGTVGHPAPDLEQGLACPIDQLLVAPSGLPGEPFRGRQGAQERQRPDSSGPRNRDQQHDHHPAQTAGLDEMPEAGAHRVAVDAVGLDLRPPAALDRLVDANDVGLLWHEAGDQEREQALRDGTARPAVPIEPRWSLAKPPSSRRPRMLNAAVTVRRPGVRSAPATSTRACRHVGRVNSAAKGAIQHSRLYGTADMTAAPAGCYHRETRSEREGLRGTACGTCSLRSSGSSFRSFMLRLIRAARGKSLRRGKP